MRHGMVWMMLGCLLVGCQAVQSPPPPPTPSASLTFIPPSKTFSPTMTTPPTATLIKPTETALSPTPTLTATAAPACITLFYEENAQVELVSSKGKRVLVDVYDPRLLSSPATPEDVLLTTHTHRDHIQVDFQSSFPGQQLMARAGSLQLPDVIIQGIPSAHNATDRLSPEGGTNTIYLIEMDGMRIAHFGDIGQKALTPEQLDSLGRVDLAITQFANPYSDMNAQNQKGFHLMDQVEPRLIIPTHIDLDTARLAVAQWQGLYSDLPAVRICAANLPVQTQILFLGQRAAQYAQRLQLIKVNW